jgi:hypothetical protein
MLLNYDARLGSDDKASDPLADLARVCVSSRGFAVGAAEDMANTYRSRVGRVFRL